MKPMLAFPMDTERGHAEVARLSGPKWGWQQKYDGERMLIEIGNEPAGFPVGPVALNRHGDPSLIPVPEVLAVFAGLTGAMAIDGELVRTPSGPVFVAFDMPYVEGAFGNDQPFERRYAALAKLIRALGERHPGMPVKLAALAVTPEEKAAMSQEVAAARGEGWVAKLLASPYEPGERPRTWQKIKRMRDIDCIVEWVGDDPAGKANMGLTLFRDGQLVDGGFGPQGRRGGVGECGRLTGDGKKVKPGDVVTVQILNVSDGDRLFQPTRPRIRTDKMPEECTWDQLEPLRADKALILEAIPC